MTDSTLHAKAEKALKSAVSHLVQEQRKVGGSLMVWRNGRVARLSLSRRKKSSRPR